MSSHVTSSHGRLKSGAVKFISEASLVYKFRNYTQQHKESKTRFFLRHALYPKGSERKIPHKR